eukprot:Colp12_sorted_trinity150504_noHs@5349
MLALDVLDAIDAPGKILGHSALGNSVNANILKGLRPVNKALVAIELATVSKTTGPCEDGSNGVGAGLLALLVLAEVTGNGAVGSLSLNSLTVGADKDGGHKTEGTVALSDKIRHNITIIVLASPHETTVRLDGIGHHVVNKAVLVPDALLLERLLVLLVVNLGENVTETTVILFQNGVLGAKVQRPALVESEGKAAVRKPNNRLFSVVHSKTNTAVLGVVVHLPGLGGSTASGLEGHGVLASLLDHEVSAAVLVTKSVTTHNNGLGPARDKAGNVGADNGLTENSAVKNVTDSSVGALPHLLKLELLNSVLIRSDGGTLDADLVLSNSVGGINGNLIVGGITVGEAKIEVESLHVHIGVDELILNPCPDNSGHLITIKVNNRVLDSNLAHRSAGHVESTHCESRDCTGSQLRTQGGSSTGKGLHLDCSLRFNRQQSPHVLCVDTPC